MKRIQPTDAAHSPPGRLPRSETSFGDDAAEPSRRSGFGTVMEKERHLLASTEASRPLGHRANSTSLRRMLRAQSLELGGNIALLEQRYEAQPPAPRSHASRRGANPPAASVREDNPLPALIDQHRRLLAKIALLATQRPDGQRGELILAEVARSHRRMIVALTSPGLIVRDSVPAPVIADAGTGSANATANVVSAGRTREGDRP